MDRAYRWRDSPGQPGVARGVRVAKAPARLQTAGAPADIADTTAALSAPLPLLAVAHTAGELGIEAARVARAHLLFGQRLGWPELLDQAAPHTSDDHSRHVAAAAVRLTIEQHGMDLVREYLGDHGDEDRDAPGSVEAWLVNRRGATERYLATLGGIRSRAAASLSKLIVAAHELSNVVGTARR